MSYPDHGEEGVAPSFVAARDAPTLQVGATTARLVATGSLTGERYGLFRWDMSATSGRATPHLHRTFSEAFYVLDGTVAIDDGAARSVRGLTRPGSVHGDDWPADSDPEPAQR